MGFSFEDDDSIGCGDGVFIDLIDGLVDHMVSLFVQFVQVFQMVVQVGLAHLFSVKVVLESLLFFLMDLVDAFGFRNEDDLMDLKG